MSSSRWSRISAIEPHSFVWGDRGVVFNSANSDTHLLDSRALWVLQQLDTGALGETELLNRAITGRVIEATDNPANVLAEILEQLREIDLLQCARLPDSPLPRGDSGRVRE